MDTRIAQLERLAALHRDGALTDDEFRQEKLRVLAGDRAETVDEPVRIAEPVAEPLPPPVSPVATAQEPVAPVPPPLQSGRDLEFGDRFEVVEEPRRRSGLGLALAIGAAVVLALAVWFMRSTPVDETPRSTIGSAEPRERSPDEIVLDGMTANALAPADRLAETSAKAEDDDKAEEPQGSDIAGDLALANPGSCGFGAQGQAAFDALLSRSGGAWDAKGPVRLGSVTLTPKLEVSQINPTRPAGEEPADPAAAAPQREPSTRYYSTARAPDGVTWNGLKFSRLVRSHVARPGGGTVDRRGLTFLEEPGAVRTKLSGLGVDVPAAGRPLGGSCRGEMRLETIPGGSALVCERRCG